jgi:hypothetical protein
MSKTPETQLIFIRAANGALLIMQFVTRQLEEPQWEREATPENVEAEIAKASQTYVNEWLPIQGWRFGTLEELPTDRYFRDAWEDVEVDGKRQVKVHMEKARNIHRHHLWRELFIEELLADKAGDAAKLKEVRDKKLKVLNHQALLTATSIEELKALSITALSA